MLLIHFSIWINCKYRNIFLIIEGMRQERNRSKEVMKIGLDNHGKSTSTYKGGASCKFWMGRIPDSFLNVTSINPNWGLFCMERTKEQCRVSIGRKTYGSLANVNVIDCHVCLSMHNMALSFFAVTIIFIHKCENKPSRTIFQNDVSNWHAGNTR